MAVLCVCVCVSYLNIPLVNFRCRLFSSPFFTAAFNRPIYFPNKFMQICRFYVHLTWALIVFCQTIRFLAFIWNKHCLRKQSLYVTKICWFFFVSIFWNTFSLEFENIKTTTHSLLFQMDREFIVLDFKAAFSHSPPIYIYIHLRTHLLNLIIHSLNVYVLTLDRCLHQKTIENNRDLHRSVARVQLSFHGNRLQRYDSKWLKRTGKKHMHRSGNIYHCNEIRGNVKKWFTKPHVC